MPNTENTTTTAISNIVSSSPNLSRSRSFTIKNFITITDYTFKFGAHPHCERFDNGLNNTYPEPFDAIVVNSIFTDTGRTAIATDVVANIRAAIIDIIEVTSQADRAVIAPIINCLIMSASIGTSPH